MGHEQIMQAARPGKPDFVAGIEHACRIAQQLSRAIERERLQKRFRRQPGPAPEQVVQFGRGHAGGFGNGLDLGLFAPMAADMADGFAHDLVIGGSFGQQRRVGRRVENTIGR